MRIMQRILWRFWKKIIVSFAFRIICFKKENFQGEIQSPVQDNRTVYSISAFQSYFTIKTENGWRVP